MTYNAGLGLFSYLKSSFEFDPGGSILNESQIQTISVENYKGDMWDNFRAFCEVLYVIATIYSVGRAVRVERETRQRV